MNDNNIILLVGDLGAGTNMVKNILLLSEDVDWPANPVIDRLAFIKQNIYPDSLKNNMQLWLKCEYRLRNFNHYYGVDICDEFHNIVTDLTVKKSQLKKIVFLTHWPDIATRLKKQHKNIKIISLYAASEFDICWQIKAYIDKKGINDLHNFSFEQNQDENKIHYIKTHGLTAYYKFNVQNMFDILSQRTNQYKNLPAYVLPIGSLMSSNTYWINEIIKYLTINLNIAQATELLNTWQMLHSPSDKSHLSDYLS